MILSFALGGSALVLGLRTWWVRRDRNPNVCDLRRCIVIIGEDQNHPDCVAQRRALKPNLMMVRHTNINVIEIYSTTPPRRNGAPVSWANNRSLRRTLHATNGFHLICIDDDGEIAMRVRLPVSEHVVAELIDDGSRPALPAPRAKTSQPASPARPANSTRKTSSPLTAKPAKNASVGTAETQSSARQEKPAADASSVSKNKDDKNAWSVRVLR